MSDPKYTYHFIRKDLVPQQQIIQTTHATHQMAWKLGSTQTIDEDDTVPHSVLMGARNEDHLLRIEAYLQNSGINYEIFQESDEVGFTAICTYPLQGDERMPLRHFDTM